jgi:hypothetical protein
MRRLIFYFICVHSRSVTGMRITAVGHHWGPVIQTSARIGSPGSGRFPYFQMIPKGSFWCMNIRQSTNHSAFDKPVALHWWTCRDKVIGTTRTNPGSWDVLTNWNWWSLTWSVLSTEHDTNFVKSNEISQERTQSSPCPLQLIRQLAVITSQTWSTSKWLQGLSKKCPFKDRFSVFRKNQKMYFP